MRLSGFAFAALFLFQQQSCDVKGREGVDQAIAQNLMPRVQQYFPDAVWIKNGDRITITIDTGVSGVTDKFLAKLGTQLQGEFQELQQQRQELPAIIAEAAGWNQYTTITFHFNKPVCGSFPKMPTLGLNYYIQTARVEVKRTAFSQMPCYLNTDSATAAILTPAFAVGNGVSAPELISKVDPGYTEEARQSRLEGTVSMSIVVLPDGSVGDIRVINTLGFGLERKAVEAVKQWKFRPGSKDGQPVAVRATIEVSFRLS